MLTVYLSYNAKTRHLTWNYTAERESDFDIIGTSGDNETAMIYVKVTDTENILGLDKVDDNEQFAPTYYPRVEFDIFVPDPTGKTSYKPFILMGSTQEWENTKDGLYAYIPYIVLSHSRRGKLPIQLVFEDTNGKRMSSIETLILDVRNAIDTQGGMAETYPQIYTAFNEIVYDDETKVMTFTEISGNKQSIDLHDLLAELGTAAYRNIAVKDTDPESAYFQHYKPGDVPELITDPRTGMGKIPLDMLPLSVTEEHFEVYKKDELVTLADAEVGDSASVTRDDEGGSAKVIDPEHYGQWYKLFGDGDYSKIKNWIPMGIALNGAVSTIVNKDLTANRAVISNDLGKIAVSTVTDDELASLHNIRYDSSFTLTPKGSVQVQIDTVDTRVATLEQKEENDIDTERQHTDSEIARIDAAYKASDAAIRTDFTNADLILQSKIDTAVNNLTKKINDDVGAETQGRVQEDARIEYKYDSAISTINNTLTDHEQRIDYLEGGEGGLTSKVDKLNVTEPGQILAYTAKGESSNTIQGGIIVSSDSVAGTIVLRNQNGTMNVCTAVDDTEAVNKKQLDQSISQFDGKIDGLLQRIQNETVARKADVGDLWERVGYNTESAKTDFQKFMSDIGLTSTSYNNARAVMLTYNAHTGGLEELKAKVDTLDTRESTHYTEVTGSISTLRTNVEQALNTLDTDLNEEITRSKTADAKHTADINTNTTTIAGLNVRISEHDGKFVNIDEKFNTYETTHIPQIYTNKADITKNKTDIATNKSDITTLRNEVTTLEGRTDTIESNMTKLTPKDMAVPVWTADRTFHDGSTCVYEHKFYVSLKDENTGNTPGVPLSAWWSEFQPYKESKVRVKSKKIVFGNSTDSVYDLEHGLETYDFHYSVREYGVGEPKYILTPMTVLGLNEVRISLSEPPQKQLLLNIIACSITDIEDTSKNVIPLTISEPSTKWTYENESGRPIFVQTFDSDGNEIKGDVTQEGVTFTPVVSDFGTTAHTGTFLAIESSSEMHFDFEEQSEVVINHNLGTYVAIQVFIPDMGVVVSTIDQTIDSCRINFGTALTGTIILIYPTKVFPVTNVSGQQVFVHNLGRMAGVQVYSPTTGEAVVDICASDEDSVTIDFGENAFTGQILIL